MAEKISEEHDWSIAYVIFEGGGAKGIAHLGALSALDQEKLSPVGVAGTSAGAIVAALVAVGYKAEELFKDGDNHILKALGLSSPIDLLGRAEWNLLQGWKWRTMLCVGFMVLSLILAIATPFLILLDDGNPGNGGIAKGLALGAAVGAISLALLALFFSARWLFPIIRRRGLFDSAVVRRTVNEALRKKLAEHYKASGLKKEPPKDVTFLHIDQAAVPDCIPLKIVTTNVTTGELTLFDSRMPDVPVADAVAASAALPFAFRPAAIPGYTATSGAIFADGGLVSNLPTWVFRDEKRRRERDETRRGGRDRIPIYAFSLEEAEKEPITPLEVRGFFRRMMRLLREVWSFYVWLLSRLFDARFLVDLRGSVMHAVRVLQTGIFGSQDIVQDFIPDLKVIPIKTRLKTMQFDCTAKQAAEAIEEGREQALAFLQRERLTTALTKAALDQFLVLAQALVEERRQAKNQNMPHLRAILIDPVQRGDQIDPIAFRVIARANLRPDDADDILELDPNGKLAPLAFKERQSVYGNIGKASPGHLWMTKHERALLPDSLQSVIAVPIYPTERTGERPQRVLALDSSDDLETEYNDDAFMAKLVNAAARLSPKLIDQTVKDGMGNER